MGFFDDILIPPESLQQPAKLYPDIRFCELHKVQVCFQIPVIIIKLCLGYFLSLSEAFLSCHFSDEAEQVWLWEYETDEGAHDLYMDQGEEIRFRVTDEVFVDTSPTGPATAASDTAAQPGQSTAPPKEDGGEKKEAPYTLIVRKYTFLSSSLNIIKLCFTTAISFKSKVRCD